MSLTLNSFAACLLTAFATASCTTHRTDTPPLSGPSALSTSLTVQVDPDTLSLGSSPTMPGQTSTVTVTMRNANGDPAASRTARLEVLVNRGDGTILLENCGQLQNPTVVTNASGQATTQFTAPGSPPPLPDCTGFTPGQVVVIRATPVGTDFQSSGNSFASASIRMTAPSVIVPSNGIFVNFTVSPNPAAVHAQVSFSDAGSSSPGHTITGYTWAFSDGVTKFGRSVTHDFDSTGPFTATLTVTDDIGQTASKQAFLIITSS
jgi:hypothetical protein